MKKTLVILFAVLLSVSVILPAFATDYNGDGDMGAKPVGAVKAWYLPVTDQGYQVQLFCSRILGAEGSDGSAFINKKGLVEFSPVLVFPEYNNLVPDAIVCRDVVAWGSGSGELTGEDILTMFTDDVGLATIQSWYPEVSTPSRLGSYLRNEIGTFYLDSDMTRQVSGSSVNDLEECVNWYIRVESYLVIRGLGEKGDEKYAGISSDYAGAQGWEYNFLSQGSEKYDYVWMDPNGSNSYTYSSTAKSGWNKIYTGMLDYEAVPSPVFSLQPRSLYFTESWFGEMYWETAAEGTSSTYWSIREMENYGGRGWIHMGGKDPEDLVIVTLVAEEGVESVALNGKGGRRKSETFAAGDGSYTYRATPGYASLVELRDEYDNALTYRDYIVQYYRGEGDEGELWVSTDGDGVCDTVFSGEGATYSFYKDYSDIDEGKDPEFELYITPGPASFDGWYDESDRRMSWGLSGSAAVPTADATYYARANIGTKQFSSLVSFWARLYCEMK